MSVSVIAATGAPSLTLAVTGATGFVGQAVVERALAEGHHVRALTRSPKPDQAALDWVTGSLADAEALDRLTAGADAVLHIAGAVNVPTRADFAAANIDGTAAVLTAAAAAGVPRFIHVSSLAAREPGLSNYGWSKAGAETLVSAAPLYWSIIRPPGVYGPRDADMLETFKMAKRGRMFLPPAGRGSWVYVEDLARLLCTAATHPEWPMCRMFEVEGGPPGGVTHLELAQLISNAAGCPRARLHSVPGWAMLLGGVGDRLVRGKKARLTPDRARYMRHPDWVSRADLAVPAALWQPAIPLEDGLAATADWYRNAGWL